MSLQMRNRIPLFVFWILTAGLVHPACAQKPLAIYVLNVDTSECRSFSTEDTESLTTSIQTAFSKYPDDFKMLERGKLYEIAKQSNMEQNLKSFARGGPSSPQLRNQLFSEAHAVLRGKLINTSDGAFLTLSLTKFNSEIPWKGDSDRYRLSEWLTGKRQVEVASELATAAVGSINSFGKTVPPISTDNAVRGLELAKQGNCPKAIEYLKNAAPVDPKNTEVFYQLGRCQNQAGDYESAVHSLGYAIATNAQRSELFVERAISYSGLKDFQAAQRDVDQALNIDPGNLAAIELRGDISMQRGRYAEAVEAYYGVYEQQPTRSRCQKLADAYTKNGARDASVTQERACRSLL